MVTLMFDPIRTQQQSGHSCIMGHFVKMVHPPLSLPCSQEDTATESIPGALGGQLPGFGTRAKGRSRRKDGNRRWTGRQTEGASDLRARGRHDDSATPALHVLGAPAGDS